MLSIYTSYFIYFFSGFILLFFAIYIFKCLKQFLILQMYNGQCSTSGCVFVLIVVSYKHEYNYSEISFSTSTQ